MLQETRKTSIVLTSIMILFSGVIVPHALAEEIIISNNGGGSSNEVTVSSSHQTNVESTNTAEINNNIQTTANTGDNTANSNTGQATSIITGNITEATNVTNNANTSVVQQLCCDSPAPTSIHISNNGAHSTNAVNNNTSSQTNITVTNTANVVNNVTTYANTGGNTANNNTNSDVTIKTGNIFAKETIFNSPLNIAKVSVSKNFSSTNPLLKIIGNGAFSLNTLNNSSHTDTYISINNVTDILNNIKSLLETGNNTANGNTGGKVAIVTGDVISEILIKNAANISEVKVTCADCKEKEKPEEKPQPAAPAPAGVTGGGPSVGGSGAGPAGEVLGAILPVTGNNLLFFLLIANILMFLMGAYLRLRSGNSPGLRLAL